MIDTGEKRKRNNEKQTISSFWEEHVFQPVLDSKTASKNLKSGVSLIKYRMSQRDAARIIYYFWSAVVGAERSVGFSKMMKEEGFGRFEEVIDAFRNRFNDRWLLT